MATQTLSPFGSRSFFEVESKKCFKHVSLAPIEPALKKQRTSDEDEVLLRNMVTGPSEVQLNPITFFPSFNSNLEQARMETDSQEMKSKLQLNLEQWEKLHQREEELIQQAKNYLANLDTPTNVKSILQTHKLLASEISSFMENRNSALDALLQASTVISSSQDFLPEPVLKFVPPLQLTVIQQPGRMAVSNRHISPSPAVQVLNFDAERKLFVSVRLVSHETEEEIIDLLLGTTRVEVDGNGVAMFAKLKIAELSTKHRQQSFGLLFSLESSENSAKVLASVKSDSFQTQSRPTGRIPKRRREDDDSPKYYGSTSSDEDYVQQAPRDRAYDPISFENSKTHVGGVPEYNYVDITEYLTLPQKEAATKLGISESMLCKRFKECTRRKWPYRYIRKIDKVISMLCVHDGAPLSPDDKKKLDKLAKEREERLQPVKIRITSHDRTLTPLPLPVPSPTQRSRSPSPSPSDSSLSDPTNFNDEEQFVLETLEMLKTQRSPKDS